MIKKFKELSDYRDSILVLSIFLYAMGYAVWSLHAWRNHLGFLPALDLQYFIAGVLPLISLVLFYWLVTTGRAFLLKVRLKLGKDATGNYKTMGKLLNWYFFLSIIFFFLTLFIPWFEDLIIVALILMIIGFVFAPSHAIIFNEEQPGITEEQKQKVIKWNSTLSSVLSQFFFYYVLIAAMIIFFFYYLSGVYPSIPQELGGVRPRKAIFSMSQKEITHEVALKLGGKDSADVFMTEILDVYYYNSDKFIVKNSSGDLFEMATNRINFIQWMPEKDRSNSRIILRSPISPQ